MKKLRFILAILVIALVFAGSTMTLASCNNNTTKGGGGGSVSGTYYFSQYLYITFSGNTWSEYSLGSKVLGGTYNVSGRNLTLHVSLGYDEYWTIVDDRTLRDEDGDLWTK